MKSSRLPTAWFTLIIVLLLSTTAYAQNKQIVAGAGPSTEICKLFFSDFDSSIDGKEYSFTVMDGSVKHKGGILNSDKFLFGRTGRPLTDKEKALNKEQIFLAKVPITFAKGLEVNIAQLTMKDIERIYLREVTNWKTLGGPDAPILLVGREPSEALFMTLKEDYSFFKGLKFDKVFKKDHEVVKYLSSPLGRYAVAFGAKPNFPKPNILDVNDFSEGVKVGLVYDLKNSEHPVVKKAQEKAASKQWIEKVMSTEMLPVN
jgi:hypothetical protein